MFEDTTYLHFVLFFTSAINDVFLKRPWGRTSYYHMAQTITSLNDKLARNELEDSTIAVVSSLVIVCAILTDYTAAKTHFTGLQQMVRLRGGLEAFRDNLGLYIKLARVDLAYALHTGQAPLFIHPGFLAYVQPSAVTSGTPHGSHIKDDSDNSDYPSSSLSSPISPRSYLQIPKVLETLLDDSSVVSVFSDLQRLSCSLNHRRRLQDSDFKLAICSIQYRLLLLEGTLDDTMAECLRLAMLTFLTTTFEIPEGPGQRYPHLSRKFRESCCALIGDSMPGMLSGFATWLLVIGGVSLYGLDEDWLCKRWRSLVPVGASWYEVRRGLKTFLWIDAVHDRLGKEMVNTLDQNGARKMATGKTKSSPWWLSGWGICPLEL
ncbi:hypothetical protein GQ53DRAFT_36401 [Thozetella sp. PMI_491]|nr:hypothetical protein GQ53DRAFT_36401 [Thozetella sp. PMI_491]